MNEIETLKLNYEFKNVFNKGKYFIGKQVIVYIYKNKKKQNRIGIAISSKMFNAVKRNHIKRLIRERLICFLILVKLLDMISFLHGIKNVSMMMLLIMIF